MFFQLGMFYHKKTAALQMIPHLQNSSFFILAYLIVRLHDRIDSIPKDQYSQPADHQRREFSDPSGHKDSCRSVCTADPDAVTSHDQ